MKITDLAALVAVRNHILTVTNDRSVTNRDDNRSLHTMRLKLDKEFVRYVKEFDINSLEEPSEEVGELDSNTLDRSNSDDSQLDLPIVSSIETELKSLAVQFTNQFNEAISKQSLRTIRTQALGKNGSLTKTLRNMKNVPANKRSQVGEQVNAVRKSLEDVFESRLLEFETQDKVSAKKTKKVEVVSPPRVQKAIDEQKAILKEQGRKE